MGWWSVNPWVLRLRGKTTYVERQETRTGSSIRQPTTRVFTAGLLLLLNVFVHHVNPIALSHAPVYLPVYGTAYNFLFRPEMTQDTSATYMTRVILAMLSTLFGFIIARFVIFPRLHRSLTMFSAGHESFWYPNQKEISNPQAYRNVQATANNGKPYSQEIYIGSSSQGSWAVVFVFTPFFVALCAAIFNLFLPSELEITATLDIMYIQVYPAIRAITLVLNALMFFTVLDSMFQDSNRCDNLYNGWMHTFRKYVWKHQVLRIGIFWIYLGGVIAFAAVGLPSFSQWYIDALSTSPSSLLMESWRSFLSGIVVVLDLIILMQDWDFPTLATVKGIYIPGLHTETLAIKCSRHQLVFTGKWLITSLVLCMIPLDMWVFCQQFGYEPKKYGQFASPTTYQIFSIADSAFLQESMCGSQCFRVENTTDVPAIATMGRYFGWPLIDQMPAIYVILIALFLFFRMVRTEDSRYVVSSKMQGFKAKNYELQMESSSLTEHANHALKQLASIKHYYSLRKHVDSICITFAMLGLILMLFQLHTIWEVSVAFRGQTYPQNSLSAPGQTHSLLISLTTIILGSQLLTRTNLTLEISKLRHKIPECATIWRHPTLRLTFLIELIVNLWIVPPFITGFVVIDEFQFYSTKCDDPMIFKDGGCYYSLRYPIETLGLVLFLRLYWIIRLVRNHSGFYGQRVDFLGSLHNVTTDSPLWHFRAIFHHRPVFAFVSCTLLIWLSTAVGVSVMERSIPSALDSDLTASWLIVVTMATVGYGDYYARTRGGRVITVMGGIIGGTIVISMLTSLFMGSLQTTFGEERVLYVVRYKRWQRARLDASVNLIASAWKYHKLKREGKDLDRANRALFKYMQQVRELRLGAVANGDDVVDKVCEWQAQALTPLLDTKNIKRNQALDELEAKVRRVTQLVHTIDSLVQSSKA
ncbi:Voltage-gated Ion Channel (VIC) Superfamily [Thraustotheca clavata]|uniref:Voltage-gated Ion Channel (VIC) Superfamily n=1 Tax=Thraustotheca clavata TaxID=74557 RepID=A0A1W0A7D3_9STRA|nr:Voltage-gated Ion Channel (VIC) Superfamily [Thraustotheca clavata]